MTIQRTSHAGSDAGHQLVVGPTRAGKSRGLAAMVIDGQSEQAVPADMSSPACRREGVSRGAHDDVVLVDHRAEDDRR